MRIINLVRLFTISFLLLIVNENLAQAPEFVWIKKAEIEGDGWGVNRSALDALGNTYITGYFRGKATFGDIILHNSGSEDMFIAKYDSLGNLAWAKRAGGPGSTAGGGIAVDNEGNAYVTGSFQEGTTFGNTSLSSSGISDIFISKYDAAGNLLWATRAGGGPNYDIGYDIGLDKTGSLLITGVFKDSITFGNITLLSSGHDDIFLAKFNTAGDLQWAQRAGGPNRDETRSIALDHSGNIYITGGFYRSATFGSNTLTSPEGGAVFVAKYDTRGNLLWARKAQGGEAYGYDIAVDAAGSCYITGYFFGNIIFGNTTFTSDDPTGKFHPFVAKYDSSGNYLWAQTATGHAYGGFGYGIAVDKLGNSYITGGFRGNTTFGSTTLISNGYSDGFIAKYNPEGDLVWAQRAGSGPLNDYGFSIAVDESGSIYISGYFYGASFGSTYVGSTGSGDIFVAKLKQTMPPPVIDMPGLSMQLCPLKVYPNPTSGTFILDLSELNNSTEVVLVEIVNVLGQPVLKAAPTCGSFYEYDFGNLAEGPYFIRSKMQDKICTEKLILLR